MCKVEIKCKVIANNELCSTTFEQMCRTVRAQVVAQCARHCEQLACSCLWSCCGEGIELSTMDFAVFTAGSIPSREN